MGHFYFLEKEVLCDIGAQQAERALKQIEEFVQPAIDDLLDRAAGQRVAQLVCQLQQRRFLPRRP